MTFKEQLETELKSIKEMWSFCKDIHDNLDYWAETRLSDAECALDVAVNKLEEAHEYVAETDEKFSEIFNTLRNRIEEIENDLKFLEEVEQ